MGALGDAASGCWVIDKETRPAIVRFGWILLKKAVEKAGRR
jgi:hypothetical protein